MTNEPIVRKQGDHAVDSNYKYKNSLLSNLEELQAKRLSDAERARLAKAMALWRNKQLGKA